MSTVRDRYTAAVNRLANQGIPCVLDRSTRTADDSWCEAERVHGHRVAVASETGAYWQNANTLRYSDDGREGDIRRLYFSFPYDDLTVGHAVDAAFAAEGFAVEWDGSPQSCVVVTL